MCLSKLIIALAVQATRFARDFAPVSFAEVAYVRHSLNKFNLCSRLIATFGKLSKLICTRLARYGLRP